MTAEKAGTQLVCRLPHAVGWNIMTAHHAGRTVLSCLYRVSGLNSKITGAYFRIAIGPIPVPMVAAPIRARALLGTKDTLVGQVADVLIGGVSVNKFTEVFAPLN